MPPLRDGILDASHTLKVGFDTAAAPALLMRLADSIAPQYADCSFAPALLDLTFKLRLDESQSCLSQNQSGVLPVAI